METALVVLANKYDCSKGTTEAYLIAMIAPKHK